MNTIQKYLKLYIKEFHIPLNNGLEFWPPYLRNDNHAEVGNTVPRGLGKASPEELRMSAEYILTLFPTITAQEIRNKLIDGSLPEAGMNYKGIDCSGFVFYVMDGLYKKLFSKSLTTDLAVPKAQVLNGAYNFLEWRAAHKLTDIEEFNIPDNVPVDWVVDTFHRKPVNLCGVSSLVSDYSSCAVDVYNCRPSDLLHVKVKNDPIPHLAIVTDVKPYTLTVIHSGRKDPHDSGGILTETIPRTNSTIDTLALTVPREFLGIRRLKSLAEHV